MSIEEVRLKAERFVRRNRRDLVARSAFAVIAAVFCGIVAVSAGVTPVGVIAGLVMAMLLTSTVKNFSHRRSEGTYPAVAAGPHAALTPCLKFYRRELERQREIAGQPAWQLATALLIIAWLIQNALTRNSTDPLRLVLPFVLCAAAGLIVLLAVRKFEARRVQDEIDTLAAFEEEKHSGGSHDVTIGE